MKKRIFTTIAALFVAITFFGSDHGGINFTKGDWNQIRNIAKESKKLIFVDFYTQWCGPCLAMKEEVFVIPSVIDVYNKNFVCAMIDAEKGEGIELAKKYGVRSYPTFLFIDPNTGDIVHRSSSRQDAETFIFTAMSALDPQKRSPYLESNYEAKKGDMNFLDSYLKYKISVYDRDAVQKVMEYLVTQGYTLKDKKMWGLFCEHINGYDNSFFKDLAANYEQYVSLYGKEEVDKKLAKESTYIGTKALQKLPDFDGKKTNMAMNRMSEASRGEDKNELLKAIESGINDPEVDKEKFLNAMRFAIRLRDLSSTPTEWLKTTASLLQYLAYNYPDRRDPYVHQEYAACLEELAKRVPNAEQFFPVSIVKGPENGEKEYSMRSKKLAPKPVRK